MFIVNVVVDFSGPPPVINFVCPYKLNEAITVVIKINTITFLISGRVTYLNFAKGPAPSKSAASYKLPSTSSSAFTNKSMLNPIVHHTVAINIAIHANGWLLSQLIGVLIRPLDK